MIGQTLAHYRITAALGAGGMGGEVYRATDTKLGRDVAIKVLPGEVAQDPERLARFRREAQLLASLNQPNVAAIHGLEEAIAYRSPGFSAGGWAVLSSGATATPEVPVSSTVTSTRLFCADSGAIVWLSAEEQSTLSAR